MTIYEPIVEEIALECFEGLVCVTAFSLLLDLMTNTITPLLYQLVANRKQSRTSAHLRGSLLPKLLNGERRVTFVTKSRAVHQ